MNINENNKNDENIKNALHVMYRTYENIEKLMAYCCKVSEEAGYSLAVPHFLRWKSNTIYSGWLTNVFILLFQREDDSACKSGNGWKDGPIYAVEICLGLDKDDSYYPSMFVSKFEYENINLWSKGCSRSSYWQMHNPVHFSHTMDIEQSEPVRIAKPNSQENSKAYWGLEKVTTIKTPLSDITADNLREKIFGAFDKLKSRT